MSYRNHARPKDDVSLCKDVYYDLCDLEGRVSAQQIHNYDLVEALKFNKHSMLNILETMEGSRIAVRLMKIEAKIRKFLR